MGGGASGAIETMGGWVNEPPFAAELRARYGQLVEAARIRAGGRKVYHVQPMRGKPEPTYDLVGGALSPNELHQIDLARLAQLYQKGEECYRAGQLREARWVLNTYCALQAEMAAPILAELMPLRDRWAKAEERDAQGWESEEKAHGAFLALQKMAALIASLAEQIEAFAPKLVPAPLFPEHTP